MIDTHTHLYMPDYAADNAAYPDMTGNCEAVDRAVAAGVDMMILPCVDRDSVEPMERLHSLRPDNTRICMGLHPTEVKENWKEEIAYLMGRLRENPDKYCSVGEIGIDLYWDKTFADAQMQAFEQQLAVARELNKPVNLHCREGLDQTLEVLQNFPDIRAVFHCFGGSEQDIERIRKVGDYYFGIGGIVTFKKSPLPAVLPAIGLDRILTETDAPFLAPTPNRGKRNESAWIPIIVDSIAQALALPTPIVQEKTNTNGYNFFNL